MLTRTTRTQVTFSNPFRLAGFDSVQPPGTYTLSVEEEQLDALLSLGWREIAATLELQQDGATGHVSIDMQELRDALLRDTGQSTDPPAAPSSAIAQTRRARRILQLRARRS